MSLSNIDFVSIPVLFFDSNESVILTVTWRKYDSLSIRNFTNSNKKFSYYNCKMAVDNKSFEHFCIKSFFIKAELNNTDLAINSDNFYNLEPDLGRSILNSYFSYINSIDQSELNNSYSSLIDVLKGKASYDIDDTTKIYYLSVALGIKIEDIENLDIEKMRKLYDIAIIKDNLKNIDIINFIGIALGGKPIL